MGLGISPQAWGTVSTGLSVGGAVTSAVGAYSSASGARAQANIDDTNARLSQLGEQQARLQGQHEEEVSSLRTAELKSTQRASFASNGVDLSSGSVNHVLTGTDLLGADDLQTIKGNALRAAFGYQTQAINSMNAADGKRAIDPTGAAFTSLVGGGARVAREWYTLNKGTTVTPPPANTEPNYQYGSTGP